jgi:hypothetical protein
MHALLQSVTHCFSPVAYVLLLVVQRRILAVTGVDAVGLELTYLGN